MAQFARPASDIDNTGGWTTSPLWSDIDDSVGSGDGSVVLSDSTPTSAKPFTVDGTTISDPSSSSGHVLRIRGAKNATGGANYDLVCQLRQGYASEASQGNLIATVTISAKSNTTLETAEHTLSGAEADSITDHSDLQFRCWAAKNGGGAGRQCQIADVELETPDAATILSPNGIASGTSLGTPAITVGAVTVSPTGIASGTSFGSPAVNSVTTISPNAIASTASLGTPAITTGPVTVSPNAIASGTSLGSPTVSIAGGGGGGQGLSSHQIAHGISM